ncbi:hypothetical protein [Mucilaginibacter ginsenosidivorans]|uniref:Uncharacterized protein n=1 Tax=Mucilaginibacter ginsenosidivorans TaxID=398053 RepID=A0A5B8V1W5_9SPHI|nr:hypothetical protein [Mucilaginibacter ginsenosidivorans]QEC64651.1 hypothetical protein FRZ54_19445 [Mucilaginibacter ginsenosidivorans]
MVSKTTTASAAQKENFRTTFAEIVKDNPLLKDQYSIQFFETAQKSNYAFSGRDGKSMNILLSLTLKETEKYKILKSSWLR